MHRRLTASFVVMALVLAVIAFTLRSVALTGALRDEAMGDVRQTAKGVSSAITAADRVNQPIDADFLANFRSDDQQVVLMRQSGHRLVSTGGQFTGETDPNSSTDLWASADVPSGYVVVSQGRQDIRNTVFSGRWIIFGSLLMILICASIAGVLMSRMLATPFRTLAKAAETMGRGRFDLDLPASKLPEAQAISAALSTSADQLRDRVERAQSFAEHASHVLRTPLTALRFELEDLSFDADVSDELRAALDRCVARIDALDAVTGELVKLARQTAGLPGAEVTIDELAAACSQRWADELDPVGRAVTLSVEGELTTCFTPGPFEHLHELLLVDVLHRSRGDVALAYAVVGEGEALKISVSAGSSATPGAASGRGPGAAMLQIRAAVAAMGGRIDGERFASGVVIRLPRR